MLIFRVPRWFKAFQDNFEVILRRKDMEKHRANIIKRRTEKRMKRNTKKAGGASAVAAALAVAAVVAISAPIGLYANTNPPAIGAVGQGRTAPANHTTRPLENDFHTAHWQRFSHNYYFHTGPDYRLVLGQPTQTDSIPANPAQSNIRRDAGASFNPPPGGFGNGVFATDVNNIFAYVSIADGSGARVTTNFADSGSWGVNAVSTAVLAGGSGASGHRASGGQMLASTSLMVSGVSGGSGASSGTGQVTAAPPPGQTQRPPANITNMPNPGLPPGSGLPPTSTPSLVTAPSFFNDSSMGRLSIPRIGINNARVFHGVSYSIIDNHIGHFPTTSAWDGNIGLAAHNGGRAGYFERLHQLGPGDIITFATPAGARVYEVTSTHIIHETDFSLLGWSHENTITLVTCVAGRPTQRLVVVGWQVG